MLVSTNRPVPLSSAGRTTATVRTAPRTALMSVYRLEGVDPTVEAMRAAILPAQNRQIHVTRRGGCDMILAVGSRSRDQIHWQPTVASITGFDLVLGSKNPYSLVLVAVDTTVYAMAFGNGATLLDPAYINSGFGMRFAVRVLDPDHISELIRNGLTGKSRVESTMMAGGASVASFGIAPWGNVVRKLAGRADALALPTAGRLSHRGARISGSDHLSIRLGCTPDDLIADLREITKISETASPVPRLEWASRIRVLDRRTDAPLIEDLDARLGRRLDTFDTDVDFAIPLNALPVHDDTRSYAVKIAGKRRLLRALGIETVITETWALPEDERVPALRRGYVQPFADQAGREPNAPQSHAISWITAEVAIGPDVYVLMEGRWHYVGAEHLDAVRAEVREILARSMEITLPAWPKHIAEEKIYLEKIAGEQEGMLLLDRKLLRTALHRHGIEACDLLHLETGTMIHVKKASSSSPISHQIAQAIVSADALHQNAESRAALASHVYHYHKETLDPGFRPRKVVLGIKWKDGQPLTVHMMPTFAQIALLYAVHALRGIEVFVVAIDAS